MADDVVGTDSQQQRLGMSAVAMVFALLALLAPWMARTAPNERVGLLLVFTAVLEIAHGFRRSNAASQRAAWVGGGITLAMGLLLVNAPLVATTALALFLAGWFGLDAVRYLWRAAQQARAGEPTLPWVLSGLGNLAVALVVLALRGRSAVWAVAIAGALRIAGTAWNIMLAPVFSARDSADTVLDDLRLAGHPELAEIGRRVEEEEAARAPIDRGWIIGFIAVLFAIHLGRMGLDKSFLGVVSPLVAVLGDLVFALLIAFVVIIPLGLTWRKLTRRIERRLWSWSLDVPGDPKGLARKGVRGVLMHRLRFGVRLRQARYAFGTALSRGLQIGLPMAAIIAATVPVWGMSWYFDTENWAAGMWNSWAEERTDTWREAMVRAEIAELGHEPGADAARMTPPGVADGQDFSFVVIGDTGEGDASQHVLRDRYLDVVRQDDVKFVVISSDVVYPVGAMKDYELKFWLPFKGTHKPVYAIPGNHDWYDALEAFNATFLQPTAARAAMRARIEVDNRITTTTDARIEELIAKASRLKREYGVPVQFQTAPFFEVHNDRFALVAVDTGVARTVDPVQLAWLRGALARARGKFTMAVLGHPFYAGGSDTVGDSKEFGALRQLLRDHDVRIVMAGDTHDLEYYAEKSAGSSNVVHNFVNGGGGAYLSFGTSLAWPAQPPTPEWAFYPTNTQVVEKIVATTPTWKWPAWWWTREFGAWPFSAEWLSAAFDINQAPFFQSFVEIRVESSANRVRLIPHGVHGRLRWSDLQMSAGVRPADVAPNALAEWVVEMTTGGVPATAR